MDFSLIPWEWWRWLGIALLVAASLLFAFDKRKHWHWGKQETAGRVGNLQGFAQDLTILAREAKIDPVIGRDEEIRRVIQVLTRRTKNNVILIGPPGVGKTAIVEGLALDLAAGNVPTALASKKILSLPVGELMAGTKYRGEFEERVKKIIDEIRNSNRSIILFIDELHTVMQAKGTEGAINFADILKPALARGDLQLIGATTMKEYEEYIKNDESMARRFQLVMVDEPTVGETVKILQGLKKNYENYHKVKYSEAAIEAAARLSEEYIKGRLLPDKAIDVIDEAAAMVNVNEGASPDHAVALLHGAAGRVIAPRPDLNNTTVETLKQELSVLREQEESTEGEKELIALRKKIFTLVKEIEEEENRVVKSAGWPEVTVRHIKEVVADWVDLRPDEIH